LKVLSAVSKCGDLYPTILKALVREVPQVCRSIILLAPCKVEEKDEEARLGSTQNKWINTTMSVINNNVLISLLNFILAIRSA
jgi:hypothetical protein